LDEVISRFQKYCKKNIKETDLPKTITIDTKIYPQEREQNLLQSINEFAPFGEGNEEPSFLFENVEIKKIEKVGN
jgi:single-stranded DNA-specific DHH superfamily exonuclease